MSYFHDIQIWIEIVSSIIGGLVFVSFLTNSILLFACAQSPYNMRGLLAGFYFYFISRHYSPWGDSLLHHD